MNDKVKALLKSVRDDLDADVTKGELVQVYRSELEALVTYWEIRAAEDELEARGIVVGDRVESLEDAATLFGGIPKGTTGTVYQIVETGRHYPYSVETDSGVKVAYQRHEIRLAR